MPDDVPTKTKKPNEEEGFVESLRRSEGNNQRGEDKGRNTPQPILYDDWAMF